MKKFFRVIFKFLRRLLLIICLLLLVALATFFAFPEKVSGKAVEQLTSNVYFSVGSIAWRKNGADFYDINLILPGTTSEFHKVSLKINKKKYFLIDIAATDGKIVYSTVEHKDGEIKPKKKQPAFFDKHPIKFLASFSNVAVNTSYGARGKFDARIAGFLPKLLIEKFDCTADLSGEIIHFTKKISAEKFRANLNLKLIKPLDFDYKPSDYIVYYFNAFDGKLNCSADFIQADKIEIDSFTFDSKLKSGKVVLKEARMNLFDGNAEINGALSRKKVKGKNSWRFKYEVELVLTNIDALMFCRAFNFSRNKVSGNFSGKIYTSVFGNSVKKLDGKLCSNNPGTLYFPEAEKYIAGMQDSMQKQIFDIMVERLKIYPYDLSVISLKYDLTNRTTEMNFKFAGIDNYKFQLFYNGSWLDAINLAKILGH